MVTVEKTGPFLTISKTLTFLTISTCDFAFADVRAENACPWASWKQAPREAAKRRSGLLGSKLAAVIMKIFTLPSSLGRRKQV